MKFHAYLMKIGEIRTNVNSKDSQSKNNLYIVLQAAQPKTWDVTYKFKN